MYSFSRFPRVSSRQLFHSGDLSTLIISIDDFFNDGTTISFHQPHSALDEICSVTTLISLVGSAFCGLHLIAWSFHFPTHGARLIWQISALITTFVPPVRGLIVYLLFHIETSLNVVASVYIVARFVLVAEAIWILQYLSPSA
ncbi:hypothetical protein CPB83DRAFT_859081 [Crepidotus variabilis]|uniref:Uncharacterized protein n=1 Tax=Crepidotus variabilis TaxID=179855 RepID=A0A9P6JM93_9AGAR|nr:hypothetical protein CPB83DRAFT_859081 [Crepidotus variabilis]